VIFLPLYHTSALLSTEEARGIIPGSFGNTPYMVYFVTSKKLQIAAVLLLFLISAVISNLGFILRLLIL
jgi:hypothetical protein